MDPSTVNLLKELHGDLARKYRTHGTRIEQIWRSFNTSQRARVLKAGAAEGLVLKHPLDRTLGDVYKIVPELNLRDITEPGSDYLLDLLKHRATKSLFEQYCAGVNGGQGDAAFISNSMLVNNLRHANSFKHCFTLFISEDQYGQSFRVTDPAKYNETMAGLSKAVDAGLCVPQSTGELILNRQLYTLQPLNILIEDILEGGPTSRTSKTRPKKSDEAALAALSKLSIVAKPDKLSSQDLLAIALDQKSSLDDYLNLHCTEPVFLAHVVNNWFFSRPELVKDEKGRTLPVLTDKYISIAIFEAIHNAVTGAAIWNYLHRLLLLLDGSTDKIYRAIILQEISNVCHLEYGRVQKLFKRHVQTGTGSKHFKRISGVYDNGNVRVVSKGNPELLAGENPQLHYMLRLCHVETNASRAVAWIKKLDDLHRSHPMERENMEEREVDFFSDLVVVTGFIQSLSASLPLPSINQRKGQMFVSRLKELAAELDPFATQIDLADFAVPIGNLMEPGMAEGALNALNQFFIDKTGTKVGFLYQDLIEDCISDMEDYYQQPKAKVGQNANAKPSPSPTVPIIDASSPEVRVQQRRQKEKTRPAHSSIYEITGTTETPAQSKTVETRPIFKVKQGTADVFSAIFSKPESQRPISWTAFEAAMADLKFSVVPKFESVFTFLPPQDMEVQKSFTVHRPHRSRIEGYVLLYFAKRLKRVYGWGEQSFEVA